MSGLRIAFVIMAVAWALAGCASAGHTARATQSAAQPGEAAAPLMPAGAAETLAPDADENLAWAASVVKVDFAPNQMDITVKLFGLAGGDPAMNGLYTYIAFFVGPHEGWRIFRLGDFLDYRIISTSRGRVDLELRESIMNSDSGEIGSRSRRVMVSWKPPADGVPPSTVTMTPAE
jgi:hypothetical protein